MRVMHETIASVHLMFTLYLSMHSGCYLSVNQRSFRDKLFKELVEMFL